MTGKIKKYSLLVVDDQPANIELMGKTLMDDYEVRAVTNGREALEVVSSSIDLPDLILLDIMMPEMDGYDVCRWLKADARTRDIPVIFVTARNTDEDETAGLTMGAVDYIAKPLCPMVIKARVKAQLALKENRDQLEQMVASRTAEIHRANDELKTEIADHKNARVQLQVANRSLQDTVIELRHTQEHLVQSEKMAALGGLVAGVSHEISTPVGIAITASSFLDMRTRAYAEKYRNNELSSQEVEKFMAIAQEAAEIINTNLQRAGELISSFKQVGVDQASDEKRLFNFSQYLNTVILSLQPKLKKGNCLIQIDCPGTLSVTSYPGVFSQIITNLVINSVIHGFDNRPDGKIQMVVKSNHGKLKVIYSDNGKGMLPEDAQKIFDPFFTTNRAKGGTGLGMHIVYNLVTKTLGGQIRCESTVDEGAVFTLEVPV
jgi:C4-dicarboxylate-specific signal transduction histidine kinase